MHKYARALSSERMIEAGASDLHIIVGAPPSIRLDGDLQPVPGCDRLNPKDAQELIYSVMNETQVAEFRIHGRERVIATG